MTLLTCFILWVVMELIASMTFQTINSSLKIGRITMRSVFKGIIERLFIIIGLFFGYPQVIVAFAALKLGTRLDEDNRKRVSNDYFLLGNVFSILFALLYVMLCVHFTDVIIPI